MDDSDNYRNFHFKAVDIVKFVGGNTPYWVKTKWVHTLGTDTLDGITWYGLADIVTTAK
jgi:hypothetical protein